MKTARIVRQVALSVLLALSVLGALGERSRPTPSATPAGSHPVPSIAHDSARSYPLPRT
ncbi:MAG: hypothetical protein HY909_14425 [Deltaproteobacteria bacterium]|nr:hypothetical protein [Deltaproteobacteria bacterium]